MMTVLQDVTWEDCLFEARPDNTLETYARRKLGMSHPSICYFTSVPWLARALIDLHPEYGLLMHLDQSVADLIALVVSQENSCRFCYAATRALLWGQGMSKARIQRLEQALTLADLPPRTVSALMSARSQSRSGPPQAHEAREALRCAEFSEDEIKEISFAVANTDFSNRVHTIPAIPSLALEQLPDQLYMRLCRPLIGRWLLRHHFRGRPTPLAGDPSYPHARLVQAFAGSPIAITLGRTLEEMWTSPHITRRCKLLMLAVIARGLECEVCASDLHESILAEGLEEAALVQVLTRLDGPELEPIERLLVPFARATIWYEPASVQRHARALRDRLSGPQLLEAIGVASLGNGLCRMGAMVLDHK